MQQSGISFVWDGKIVTLDFSTSGFSPTTTILNFLRSSPVHKGTKEGCAEGDCGACTIVLGELDEDGRILYSAVDSCLMFLPSLHGKQLITVENISQDMASELHPVQKAMVDFNGSQCGYCTPGFVMSLFALYKSKNEITKENILDGLTGNLCRCTGYKPILDSALHACRLSEPDHFTANEEAIRNLLLRIQSEDTTKLIHTESQDYLQPTTLKEALILKSNRQDLLIINGCTDIALRVTKKHEPLPALLDTSRVNELRNYDKRDNEIFIGAGYSLEMIKIKCVTDLPALHKMLAVFGSKQIRVLATIGGNIGSASPISDTIPVLMAYNALVHLANSNLVREISMHEFVTGYRKTQCKPDEIITGVSIPVPSGNTFVNSYKVSKRKDLDISTVNGGFRIELAGGIVEEIVLAYGGMAAMTRRAIAAEDFLKGKLWNLDNAMHAAEIIYEEFSPISDARSGAEFRKIAARNLLLKFFHESATKEKSLV